jgi:hypothetical protein
MTKVILARVGVSGPYTNYLTNKCCFVPIQTIAGHKNEQSLDPYLQMTTTATKQACSVALLSYADNAQGACLSHF